MHVSWYQLIEKHCTVLPAKFDSGLSISVLRNEQPLQKIAGLKPIQFSKAQIFTFQTPAFGKKGEILVLGKSPAFLESQFFCERNRQSTIKFNIAPEVPSTH
jgi:hypothetical protein